MESLKLRRFFCGSVYNRTNVFLRCGYLMDLLMDKMVVNAIFYISFILRQLVHPCPPGVLSTSAPHILSKPLPAFPHINRRNMDSAEGGMNPVEMTIINCGTL